MIRDEIRTMLEAPPTGAAAPSLDDVEHTLTAGYAEALALEAERWRLERRLAGAAARLSERSTEEPDVADLGRRLEVTDGELRHLRTLLSSLRARADELRTASHAA
jgi:hypothetical protein